MSRVFTAITEDKKTAEKMLASYADQDSYVIRVSNFYDGFDYRTDNSVDGSEECASTDFAAWNANGDQCYILVAIVG